GRLTLLPWASCPAAMAGMRTSPLDEGNLNRSFPGDPYGGPTAQIADYIESVLLPQCDFVFDFHSGGSSLTYVPSALMRRPQTPETLAQGIEMLRTLGGPVGYLVDAALGDHTLTAAAARAGVRHMSTEIAGGGQVTPTALRIMESGIRRVLVKVGALSGEPPLAAAETRIMQVRGQDYYVYAPDPGLFEPLVELGEEVSAGTLAAIIHPHDTPWRASAITAFGRAGTVICKRVPGRVERGDCIFHLADDFVPRVAPPTKLMVAVAFGRSDSHHRDLRAITASPASTGEFALRFVDD